ncbi:MAG: hypothetical protein ACK5IC_08680 [Moheibacter sp.]
MWRCTQYGATVEELDTSPDVIRRDDVSQDVAQRSIAIHRSSISVVWDYKHYTFYLLL